MPSVITYSMDEFVEFAKKMVAQKGITGEGLFDIGEKMKLLTERDDLYSIGVRHKDIDDKMPGTRLHVEPDGSFSLSLAKFSFEEPTRVHNPNSWGVAAIYKGIDRYTEWERVDDGSKEGFAEMKAVKILMMGRGEATFWLDPPGDIHSQWGQDGHAAWELVLMGRNIQGKDRLFFEPENKKVWQAPVTELRSSDAGYRG